MPRALLSRAKKSLSGAYVRPWQDKTRAFLMIATLPGLFAAGLQGMTLIYTMAGQGMAPATLFNLLRMLFLGSVSIPLSFWFLARPMGRYVLAAMQIIGTFLLLIDPTAVILNGLGYVLTAGPFWAVYSQRNAAAMSRDNHGNETALLNYIQVIVLASGNFMSGLMMEGNLYNETMLVSSACYLFSTQAFIKRLPKDNLSKKALNLVGWNKPTTMFSLAVAALFALIDNGLPTWMRVIGLSPLSAGTAMGLRPILGTILTPVVGFLIQKGGLGAGKAGGVALGIGWLIMALAPEVNWLLLPALAFITVGTGLIGPLETNRWFRRRSTAAIVAREWILAAGRTASLPVIIPLAFLAPALFPFLGLAMGGAFVWGARKKAA